MWDCLVLQPPLCCLSSLPQLPVSTPPTSVNEHFFNSLAVEFSYSPIFCQLWLFFVSKLVTVLLVVGQGRVYLTTHASILARSCLHPIPQILSHLRLPEQKPVRAYQILLESQCFLRHWSLSQGALRFFPGLPPALGSGSAVLPQQTALGVRLCHAGFRDLNNYHPVCYSNWGSKCPFPFRANEFHLPLNQQRFCSDSQ